MLRSASAPGNRSRIAAATAVDRHHAGERREAAEQHGVGDGSADDLAGDLGSRDRPESSGAEARDECAKAERREAVARIDQQIPVLAQAVEHIDLIEERRSPG